LPLVVVTLLLVQVVVQLVLLNVVSVLAETVALFTTWVRFDDVEVR
jgi:hypothetical protein